MRFEPHTCYKDKWVDGSSQDCGSSAFIHKVGKSRQQIRNNGALNEQSGDQSSANWPLQSN